MPLISIHNCQRDLPISKVQMKKAVSFLLHDLKVTTDEVSVYFVSRRAICRLHRDFFNDPTPTDCITLPIDSPDTQDPAYHVLGEAFICPKTALDYAKLHQIDPQEEIYRYLTHCLLHLIGYTDTTPTEKRRMRRKENTCLKKLLNLAKLRLRTSN